MLAHDSRNEHDIEWIGTFANGGALNTKNQIKLNQSGNYKNKFVIKLIKIALVIVIELFFH